MHPKPQVEPVQVAVACAGAGQTEPQPPQLEGSTAGFTSQPSLALPLQSRYAPAQA
jgi:hypothetical protein